MFGLHFLHSCLNEEGMVHPFMYCWIRMCVLLTIRVTSVLPTMKERGGVITLMRSSYQLLSAYKTLYVLLKDAGAEWILRIGPVLEAIGQALTSPYSSRSIGNCA